MAPPTRYATVSCWASIAFAAVGEGVPAVFMPPAPFEGDVDGGVDAIARFLGVADAPEVPGVVAAAEASAEGALTARETEVLRLVARGRAHNDHAATLGMSVHTIERQLTNLCPKIACRNSAEAAVHAIKQRSV